MSRRQQLALPLDENGFCAHFGRASEFFLCDVERDGNTAGRSRVVMKKLKPGQCESVPDWLHSMGTTLVLAGGIGPVAQRRLKDLGIEVAAGFRGDSAEQVLGDWLERRQTGGKNPCQSNNHQLRHCRKKQS